MNVAENVGDEDKWDGPLFAKSTARKMDAAAFDKFSRRGLVSEAAHIFCL